MKIGKKIQGLRKAKGLTLQELAKASGVALATISRIENNRMTGTLESHIAIARALGLSLPQLYSKIEPDIQKVEVQKKDARSGIFHHTDKASYEILTTSVLSKKMMPVLLKIESNAKTALEQAKPDTEKFVFVISGKIEISIEDKKYALDANDTLYFDASLPHFFSNIGKDEARFICIITPPML
jgi:transcriptional regulator with XRE-family HTH domain